MKVSRRLTAVNGPTQLVCLRMRNRGSPEPNGASTRWVPYGVSNFILVYERFGGGTGGNG